MNTLLTLKERNSILYRFGLLCFVAGAVCASLVLLTSGQVLGINAYIKPAKFFVSTGIFCWTIAWFLPLLNRPRTVTIYAWMVVVVMMIELGIIVVQAARGKLSHFNVSSALDGLLFGTMGVAITIFTVWTAYIGYLFFRHRPVGIEPGYLWGIRLGILLFVVFAFEGYTMVDRLAHTVGAADGGPGWPVTNWSTRYGDLRIAHFFGMHALQLLPLLGYYVARRPRQIIGLSLFYFVAVTLLFMQALTGKPLLALLTH